MIERFFRSLLDSLARIADAAEPGLAASSVVPSVRLGNRIPEVDHVQGSCAQVVRGPALPGEVVEGVAHLAG